MELKHRRQRTLVSFFAATVITLLVVLSPGGTKSASAGYVWSPNPPPPTYVVMQP
jgi:hypothetical protein